MADPQKLFTMTAISRAGIAENLNDMLDWVAGEETSNGLAPDDDRLTDAICSEYARELGAIDFEDSPEGVTDAESAALDEKYLRLLGFGDLLDQ